MSEVTNDPSGAFKRPQTGIAEIDDAARTMRAGEAERRAAAQARAEQELPTPDRHVGGDVYLDPESV